MNKRIAEIMDQPEYIVKKLINKLEDKNGYPSHDVRHLADNIQKVRIKLNDLSLDPDDTTGEELYHALLAKFEKDARAFDIFFNAEQLDFGQKSTRAAEVLGQKTELPRQWALKKTVAKNVLRAQPPKRVMNHLGYRSVESMLKREDLSEIYLVAPYLESASWTKQHDRQISKLSQTDFELRAVRLQPLNYARWSDIAGPQDYVAVNNEVAAIGLWPSAEIEQAPFLTITLMLLEKLGDYQEINLSQSLAKVSDVVSWWADMDRLVANLAGEHISLNLKDTCQNSLQKSAYGERTLEHGRASFWHELLSHYENQLPTESLFDNSVLQKVAGLKLAAPQPVYEEVENI